MKTWKFMEKDIEQNTLSHAESFMENMSKMTSRQHLAIIGG